MAQEQKKGISVAYIALNYTIRIKAEDGGLQDFSDQISLNFDNEAELNMILSEKPYLKDAVTPLVKRLKEGYDSSSAAAKSLKDSLGAL